MKITWLGHSAFKLEESTGTTVVTDPYNSYVGFRMPRVAADIVTVSHGHNDHNNLAAVLGDPEVHILARRTFHDSKNGAARGENLVFKFRMDGVDICHMGDIGEECNAMLVDSIAPVNVLMIPIGGTYTIDAEEAKEFVDRIMPDVVIPMHYKTKDHSFDIAKLNDFLDLFDDEDIVYVESDTVEFDRADFDGESTNVYVLEKFSE